jgi:threonylcarbamoyladenosine tRNA methylthiotransferase MtaB
MGRRYFFEEFKKTVDKIQRTIKNVNITTDVLVGFPDETEKEFQESFENIKKINFGKIHVFRYSKRKGTRAAEWPNQINEPVKKERAKQIRELSRKLAENFGCRFKGRELMVLFENEEGNISQGLSENYLQVKVVGRGLKGKVIDVKIERQKAGFLYGRTNFN